MTLNSARVSRVGPAVAEAYEVFDLGESFIALEELLAYALDNSSNIHPIAVFAAPSDEAFRSGPDRRSPDRLLALLARAVVRS